MAAPTPSPRPGRPLAVIALLLVAMYAGAFLIQSTWAPTPKLGLDLRGGTSVTLTAQATEGESGQITGSAMEQAKDIITARVNGTGVAEAEVAVQGDRNIVINIPEGQFNPDLLTTALLRFRPVLEVASVVPAPAEPSAEPTGEASQDPASEATSESTAPEESASPTDSGRAVSDALLSAQEQSPSPAEETGEPTGEPTEEPGEGQTPATPEITPEIRQKFDNLTDCTAVAEERAGGIEPADELLVTCDRDGISKFILGPVAVEGTRLDSAEAVPPQAQGNVAWIVSIRFDKEGAQQFADTTRNLVSQPPPMNQFAIVLDGTVVSAPRVNQAILTGDAIIEGDFTQADAQDLANVLKYGALPLGFEQSELNEISPTLGADSLRGGLLAGAIGLALVVVYCLLYYRSLGIVAVASLALAGLGTYVAVVLLGEWIGFTLTLAGIAGLIVAIGITIDSFIVFFERIRDEIRDGRGLRAAVEHGWRRARRTILIADSVTIIAAAVLYILAIGNVRGFAFVLGMVTVVDLVIVFLFTKPLVTLFARMTFFSGGHRWSGLDPAKLGGRVLAPAGQPQSIVARRRAVGTKEA